MKHALVIAALAVAAASPSFAADKKSSISLFGNIVVPENGGNQGTVFLSYAHLFGSSWELEGSISQTYSSSGGQDITFSTVGLGAKYYFSPVGGGGSVLPYLKVGFSSSTSNVASSIDYTSVLGGAGLEFAMNETASTFIEAVYQQNKYDSAFIQKDSSVIVNFGIKLRF